MSRLPFWKVESIGNDFVLVHHDDVEGVRGAADVDKFLADLAIKTSARNFAIGSDGLLAVGLQSDGSLLQRMFNPDGSEDFCGNGIRCGFDHALRQGWVRPDHMKMSHYGQLITGRASLLSETLDRPRAIYEIEFELPPASYNPRDIPMNRDEEAFDTALVQIDGEVYSGSVLSTGTAHTILPVQRLPSDEEFFRVSPQIETHPLFPERTSVMWVRAGRALDLEMRIWERGAGETLGCGTGSTAAAIDYLRRVGTGGSVQVRNPGGSLRISAESWEAAPTVSGYAEEVFVGELML